MLAPLPPRVARLLWEPLCIAALNTPVARRVGAGLRQRAARRVRRGGDASDFVLPANDLSAIFPEAAMRYCAARGGLHRTGARAQIVASARDGVTVAVDGRAQPASAAIVAVGPHQLRQAFAAEALAAHPPLPAAIDVLGRARVRADRHHLAGLRREGGDAGADRAAGRCAGSVGVRPTRRARARAGAAGGARATARRRRQRERPAHGAAAGRAGARRRRAVAAAATRAARVRLVAGRRGKAGDLRMHARARAARGAAPCAGPLRSPATTRTWNFPRPSRRRCAAAEPRRMRCWPTVRSSAR